jgi:predicted nucleic acid-binding protein
MTQPTGAVIDSTVFVAAALAIDAGRRTAARMLVEDALVRQGTFANYVSAPILYEIGDILVRTEVPFRERNVVAFVDLVQRSSFLLTNVQGVVMGCRDPRDDRMMEAAMNGAVRYIVTRDKDLPEAAPHEKYAIAKTGPGIRQTPIQVVTVEAFLYEVLAFAPPPVR